MTIVSKQIIYIFVHISITIIQYCSLSILFFVLWLGAYTLFYFSPYNKQNLIIVYFYFCWTDGAHNVFLPSRTPTFPKMFFHINLILTITNTKKNLSAKSVQPFRSQPVTKMSISLLYIYIEDR